MNTERVRLVDGTVQTEVRSLRTFRGQPIGAVRHQGYLISVWQFGNAWIAGRVIRKLRQEGM